jgi:outer membrane protein assembly complex protein YaeT
MCLCLFPVSSPCNASTADPLNENGPALPDTTVDTAADTDRTEPETTKPTDTAPLVAVETYDIDCYTLKPAGIFNHMEFSRMTLLDIPGTISTHGIDQTVDNLIMTNRVTNVTWRIDDAPCGKRLVFEMEHSRHIGRLRFSGNSQISDSVLRRATDLRKFGSYHDDLLNDAIRQFVDYYTNNGFPAPEVSTDVSEPGADGAVDVTITITEKSLPQPVSVTFDIEGYPGPIWNLRLKTVFAFLRRNINRNGLNVVKLTNRMKQEQRLLRENGYQNAEVTVDVLDSSNGEDIYVVVTADVGRQIRIQFENVSFFRRRDILANWKRRHVALTQVELDRLTNMTRDRLHNDGWLDAEVETVIEEQDTRAIARVQATPGKRRYVDGIVQRGTSPVPDESLPRITGLRPPRFLGLIKTRPGPDAVDKAERAVQTYLEMQGYQRSRSIISLTETELAGVTVEVDAEPGQYQRIGLVEFDGVEGMELHKLENIADAHSVSSGQPVVNRRVRDAMTAMTRLYWEHGYSDMSVRARTRRSETETDITFAIVEGPAYIQGPLIVSGNVKTRSSLVYRLERLYIGDPFRLEKIGSLQEAMYQTGVFDTVAIRTTRYPDAEVPYQTVVMEVMERSTGEFETGIDFNSDRGLEAIVEIGERNLFGRGLHGRLTGLAGEDRQSISMLFQRQIFFGHRIENRFRTNWMHDRTPTGYDLQKLRLEVGAVRRWPNDVSLNLTYAFEREKVMNPDPDITDLIDIGDTRYGSLTPVLAIDKRDDPFQTTEGWMYQTRFKSSLDTFGTQSEFFRWDNDLRYFRQIDSDRIIVGLALRAGRAWVIRDSTLPAGERFYLGGASTNRGFSHQKCGPLSPDGNPLGGLSFILLNLETRFHLAGNWNAAVFVDAGNVFAGSPESPYFRPTAGFGLRYETPIGPIRGDIGWNLDRQPGESSYALQFALGHAF